MRSRFRLSIEGSFVSEIDPEANGNASLVYSTYLNGQSVSSDRIAAITSDAAGDAVVVGLATSADFPVTSNAFQNAIAAGSTVSGFITVVNPTASGAAQLQYSTFLDSGNPLAVKVDGNDDLFVGGSQATIGFPVTPNAFQPVCLLGIYNCPNGFIVELNPTASPANQLVYGTYLGGTTPIGASAAVTGLGLDATGKI